MGLPTRDELAGNHIVAATGQSKVTPSSNAHGKSRANGLMFNSETLEQGAQDSIAKANAADHAQIATSPPGIATEPFVMTRPKGRAVIVAKEDIDPAAIETGDADETGIEEPKAGMLTTYDAAHPSVLFHKLKQGVLSRMEVLSLRKRLTGWLRSRTSKDTRDRRKLRPARSDGSRLIQHRSGLIIPAPDEPFVLAQTHQTMDNLIAENQRLRQLVDEIVRTNPQYLRKLRR